MSVVFDVRSGTGTVNMLGLFNDVIEHNVQREPIRTSKKDRVRYKGKRYVLMGGIKTSYFICLNSPCSR